MCGLWKGAIIGSACREMKSTAQEKGRELIVSNFLKLLVAQKRRVMSRRMPSV